MIWAIGCLIQRECLDITIFLVFFGVLAQPGNENAEPIALFYFGICFFVLAVAQRIKRWFQFNRAVRQHSYYIGTSPFAFRWLPAFMHRNRRVARFIDPTILCSRRCCLLSLVARTRLLAVFFGILLAGL